MTANWKNRMLFLAAKFAAALARPPVVAVTFKCGKAFVTFQGEEREHNGIFTARQAAITQVLTSTSGGFSGVGYRLPDGEIERVNIDRATHN